MASEPTYWNPRPNHSGPDAMYRTPRGGYVTKRDHQLMIMKYTEACAQITELRREINKLKVELTKAYTNCKNEEHVHAT